MRRPVPKGNWQWRSYVYWFRLRNLQNFTNSLMKWGRSAFYAPPKTYAMRVLPLIKRLSGPEDLDPINVHAYVKGGQKHIPSVPCSMRVDRTLFVIAAQLEGQHERTKFVSTRLEDIAKVWYQNAVFIIHPGRFDNSGWAALKCAFWGSQFLRMDTQQIVTMEGLCRCSSTTPTDTSVKMIMFKIILLNRP